jgi:glucosamine-phosphate N-acetyltransferase
MKEDYKVKELTEDDLIEDKEGFLETLKNLSETGEINLEEAKKILLKIKLQDSYIYIAKVIDGQIIGTAKLIIEQKFIHQGGKVGHIEDVATRKGYEGNGIASEIIKELIELAKQNKCYKIILDCNDNNLIFYKKLGFFKHENEMRLNLI